MENPRADRIPEGFKYYNPEVDRNEIIRESHQHDYPNFRKIDIQAYDTSDLKNAHTARDLVDVGTLVLMSYTAQDGEHTLKRRFAVSFEMYVDVDAHQLGHKTLGEIVQKLRRDYALPVDFVVPNRPNLGYQMPLEEGNDDDDEDNEE